MKFYEHYMRPHGIRQARPEDFTWSPHFKICLPEMWLRAFSLRRRWLVMREGFSPTSDSKSQICRAYPAPTESVMGDMPDEVSPFRLKVGIIGAKVLIFWRNNCKFAVVTPHQSPSVTASPGRCRSPLWLQTCHRHVCLTRRASQGKPFGMSKIEMR